MLKNLKTSLPEVLIIQPDIFKDSRGFFMETYHREKYAEQGFEHSFVQDNLSYSTIVTLRGLHYQSPCLKDIPPESLPDYRGQI